jgi:hypothetical protein
MDETDVILMDTNMEPDTYFNAHNSARVMRAYSDMLAGRNSAEHELIDLDDEKDMA